MRPIACELLGRAGIAAQAAGRYEASQARLREAVELARSIGDQAAAARASARIGELLLRGGMIDQGLAEIREALEILGDVDCGSGRRRAPSPAGAGLHARRRARARDRMGGSGPRGGGAARPGAGDRRGHDHEGHRDGKHGPGPRVRGTPGRRTQLRRGEQPGRIADASAPQPQQLDVDHRSAPRRRRPGRNRHRAPAAAIAPGTCC